MIIALVEVVSSGDNTFINDSLELDITDSYQQGWLVKVDEHGCLVEGNELLQQQKMIIEKVY